MKLLLDNGDSVSLSKQNFLSSGGEGDVYTKGQFAYKIFHDSNKMLPLGKIKELSAIRDTNIIRPQNVCYSTAKKAVGYNMRFVSKALPLAQTFTKAFRDRNGIDHSKMRTLIKGLHSRVESVHKAKILIVDLNEMNFLVNNKFDNIFGIDTDSYTKEFNNWKARHAKGIKEKTIKLVTNEVLRARSKFPGNDHLLAALTEEVGELAQALLQTGNSDRSREEAVQVACVALRIIEEGDREFDGCKGKA